MTEKRWLYFALGVTTVMSVGAVTNQLVPLAPATGLELSDAGITFPDGTVQTTAAPVDPRRRFYLSDVGRVTGGNAKSACETGYHMASMWEILDPSQLKYDLELGLKTGDSGKGPPSNKVGWIRTGHVSTGTEDFSGRANCESYTSSAGDTTGTTAWLTNCWDGQDTCASVGSLPWWGSFVEGCALIRDVWCVEDYPGAGPGG